jgi:hypothetical protein
MHPYRSAAAAHPGPASRPRGPSTHVRDPRIQRETAQPAFGDRPGDLANGSRPPPKGHKMHPRRSFCR